jgi:hypothetical protein
MLAVLVMALVPLAPGAARAQEPARVPVIELRGTIDPASEIISRSPSALLLRYLQTLTDLGVNQNATVAFPLPIDRLRGLGVESTSDGRVMS